MGLRKTLAIAVVLVGCGDNITPEPDTDSSVVIALETTAPAQLAAGDNLNVACTLLENDITTMISAQVRVVNETSVVRMGETIIAAKVGTIEVSCALPDRGLVDPTPAIVEIVTGPAANVVTTITPDPVVAGNNVTATCEVYDAYGNPVDDATPELQLSPTDAGNTITDLEAFMTRAGHYTARCYVPGTTHNLAGFDVVPNLPASLVIGRWPDLPLYALGNLVEITHLVTDRYGNEIVPANVAHTVTPITGTGPVEDVVPGQWKFHGEGRYNIEVAVVPPTEGDIPLTASTEIVVNSRGPAITCNDDATMLNLTPGATFMVNGVVADANGVATLTVNGNAVTFDGDGAFSTPINTRFGMNFVDISAVDAFGETTTNVCTFLISNRYANPSSPVSDTVSLKLTQAAVDDSNRNDGLDSIDDLLHAIINSPGLSQTVHDQLIASNPLKPMSCDYRECVWGFCYCVYSSKVTYIDRSFPGPHTVSLTLVPDGMRAFVRLEDISIKLRVEGEAVEIDYDTTGWVDVDYVEIGVTLNTRLSGGRPDVAVRYGSVTVNVGAITTRFNGVDGWIINNIVVPLAQGTLRDALEDVLRNFITSNFNSALDGLLSSLDVSTLGTTFNVPRIDQSGNVPLTFGLGFSHLTTTSSRILFGIGTRFSAATANAYPTLGVPLPPGNNLLDMSVFSPSNTGVAAHVGVFNGALYALWRANYFAATIGGTTLGASVPPEVSIDITTRLPPVAYIASGQVQLHLGALDLTVNHPDLPPDLAVRLGADAHASVTLQGNDLVFGGIVVDELHVGTDSVNLSPAEQQDLEDTLLALLQEMIDQSLNNALPALPIPSFTIPSSLSTFGLPAGRQLGINSPALTVSPHHFVLRGQFGLRP